MGKESRSKKRCSCIQVASGRAETRTQDCFHYLLLNFDLFETVSLYYMLGLILGAWDRYRYASSTKEVQSGGGHLWNEVIVKPHVKYYDISTVWDIKDTMLD